LHATIDAFLAPEPGTTAGDHVVPGVATIALLLAAVLAYPRFPPGGRAALAAVLGVLCVEAGALAVAAASDGGARAEDWTGFALVPLGIALLGVALMLLWRSRKRGGHRVLRRAGIALVVVLGAYWLVAPVAIGVLATHRPRAQTPPADLGRPASDVVVRTGDGLDLAAWYVPSRNGAAVVTYPSRAGAQAIARVLVRNGYGVLVLDARGYDASEGDANLFGWSGAKDVAAAVAWLRARPDVSDGRIGGVGLSVGGEVMLEEAAANDDLRAVVSDGAGVRSVREHLLRGWRGWFSLPEAAMQTAAVAVLSGSSPPPSLADVVADISPRPVLLIHASRGGGGEELTPVYLDAAKAPKSVWRVEGVGHLGGLVAHPREYERRVIDFLDRALLEDG
jgi:fermentation-respiration switch protein FrsA (DUF1100 family)